MAQEKIIVWAVVVAQLVERLPPTLEIRGSNPVIGKTFIKHLFTVNCVEKTKIKKKRPGMAHLKNKDSNNLFLLSFRSRPSHISRLPCKSVWPDGEIKSNPIFSKSCPKRSQGSFYYIIMLFT